MGDAESSRLHPGRQEVFSRVESPEGTGMVSFPLHLPLTPAGKQQEPTPTQTLHSLLVTSTSAHRTANGRQSGGGR